MIFTHTISIIALELRFDEHSVAALESLDLNVWILQESIDVQASKPWRIHLNFKVNKIVPIRHRSDEQDGLQSETTEASCSSHAHLVASKIVD